MLTVRKSYRRVVRDARRRDTAELTRIERAQADGTAGPDRASITDVPVSVVSRSRQSGSGVVGRERDDAVDRRQVPSCTAEGLRLPAQFLVRPLPRPPHQR